MTGWQKSERGVTEILPVSVVLNWARAPSSRKQPRALETSCEHSADILLPFKLMQQSVAYLHTHSPGFSLGFLVSSRPWGRAFHALLFSPAGCWLPLHLCVIWRRARSVQQVLSAVLLWTVVLYGYKKKRARQTKWKYLNIDMNLAGKVRKVRILLSDHYRLNSSLLSPCYALLFALLIIASLNIKILGANSGLIMQTLYYH